MIGPLYNRKDCPQPSNQTSMSSDTRLTPWKKPRPPTLSLGVHPSPQSVQRVCTLSPLGVHPSPLRVISENPPLCHSVSPEGPTFPFSKASLRVHRHATLQPEGPTFPLSEASLRVHRHATLQLEDPTFPLSEEYIHEATTINIIDILITGANNLIKRIIITLKKIN